MSWPDIKFMAGAIVKHILSSFTRSNKSKGKAYINALNSALTPSAIVSAKPEVQPLKNDNRK